MRLCLIAAAVTTIWFAGLLIDTNAIRVVAWGVPAAVIVGATVLGPQTEERGSLAELAVLLGGASYAIYLIHPLVNDVPILAWDHLGSVQGSAITVMALALILSICLSALVYRWFELAATKVARKYLARCWRQISQSRRPIYAKHAGTIT